MTIQNTIFDTRIDYNKTNGSVFLEHRKGLLDTINIRNPRFVDLRSLLKKYDWDENEFEYSQCRSDFIKSPKDVVDKMIKTLAWQWEADSIASHNLIPIVAPFVSDSTLWALWSRIGDNETLHALTYSEIVKHSFDHPDEVMDDILKELEPLKRLEVVSSIYANTYKISHQLSLGEMAYDDPRAYDAIFMFVIAMLAMERIQFMASFSVTFAICKSGTFTPIGKAVQKICTDELEIHVETNKEIIKNELKTRRGLNTYQNNKELIKKIIDSVVESEFAFTDYIFQDGKELLGLNSSLVKKWVKYCANDVYDFLNIERYEQGEIKNPLTFLNEMFNIDQTQGAPQEEKLGGYMLGGFTADADNKVFDIE